jgi:hypothetical protein
MNNILSLKHHKEMKMINQVTEEYGLKLSKMDIMQLLDETTRFQNERLVTGELSFTMMKIGQVLYKTLLKECGTVEMKIVATANLNFLNAEVEKFLNGLKS